MKYKDKAFFGREYEMGLLNAEFARDRASLSVVYGRRRIGKSRLIAEFCRGKKSLRLEGLEEGDNPTQIAHILKQLAEQTGKELLAGAKAESFRDVFELITKHVPPSRRVLVFDEFPWMIRQDPAEVSLLKYYWDNYWSQKNWMVILCGSVNTFIVKELLFSSALYGRIHNEILLDPLSAPDVRRFFSGKKTPRETLDLLMVFGGIPKYLEEVDPRKSLMHNIQDLCFTKNAFFVREFDRLFHEEFTKVKIYAHITQLLARQGPMSYSEIVVALGKDIGGGYKLYLDNLEKARFIVSYSPLSAPEDTRLVRYRVSDEYLLFYFHFIQPKLNLIAQNTGKNFFLQAVGKGSWSTWTGLAFERFCLKHVGRIQEILKIDQLVKNFGALFNRATTCRNGFQIDLLFTRHDGVFTLCELKYAAKPVGVEIIEAVEKKATLLKPGKKQSVERVLITCSPLSKSLAEMHYFQRVILIEEFF